MVDGNQRISAQTFDVEEIITTIRQAEPIDARAILGLMRHVGRDTKYLTFGPEGSFLNVKQERQLIEQYAQAERSILLVIEVDEQIIGIANLAVLDNDKQSHVAEVGISIIKEYWGYGIGRIALESLIEFATSVGIMVLTLEVVIENQRAINLYKRLGFEIKGTLSKRLRSGQLYFDSYVMEKILC
ncbi:GNAT family N-acetyltransferase [Facklamia sp. DSM 111018]|uniref:GNAT family N-acetyltransferase n=1 Tax=Facklamia lactis TaxID=2749967 RepID=A0ABS0LST6_9LACT|nr:GNAT family protein [Facklamia lactis]MBG9986401.1 GNAT family N-acetyltransferase [Facklamia lactis]